MKRAETCSWSLCNKLYISSPPYSCVRQVYIPQSNQYTCLIISRSRLLLIINVPDKVVMKIKPQILCPIISFLNRAIYKIMWKDVVDRGRPQMTILRMRIACSMPKATNTYSEYVIFIVFSLQQWLKERVPNLRQTYIAWLLFVLRRVLILCYRIVTRSQESCRVCLCLIVSNLNISTLRGSIQRNLCYVSRWCSLPSLQPHSQCDVTPYKSNTASIPHTRNPQ